MIRPEWRRPSAQGHPERSHEETNRDGCVSTGRRPALSWSASAAGVERQAAATPGPAAGPPVRWRLTPPVGK